MNMHSLPRSSGRLERMPPQRPRSTVTCCPAKRADSRRASDREPAYAVGYLRERLAPQYKITVPELMTPQRAPSAAASHAERIRQRRSTEAATAEGIACGSTRTRTAPRMGRAPSGRRGMLRDRATWRTVPASAFRFGPLRTILSPSARHRAIRSANIRPPARPSTARFSTPTTTAKPGTRHRVKRSRNIGPTMRLSTVRFHALRTGSSGTPYGTNRSGDTWPTAWPSTAHFSTHTTIARPGTRHGVKRSGNAWTTN